MSTSMPFRHFFTSSRDAVVHSTEKKIDTLKLMIKIIRNLLLGLESMHNGTSLSSNADFRDCPKILTVEQAFSAEPSPIEL